MGIFYDWCSPFQKPHEVPATEAAFKSSLLHINLWYANRLTIKYFVTDEPPGVIPYRQRGWTTFEYLISWLLYWDGAKPSETIVFVSGKIQQTPSPSDVNAFEEGGEHADKVFTNGADGPLVARKFREATQDSFSSVNSIELHQCGWKGRDLARFARMLHFCNKVNTLNFFGNQGIGDEGVVAFVAACEKPGVLPEIDNLGLGYCGVGDKGFAALTRAVKSSAFPKMTKLWVDGNPASDGAKQELAKACEPRLEKVRKVRS